MTTRTSLKMFELANPLYRGAIVHWYLAIAGVKTALLAPLYAGFTGASQLPNPQKLNSNGMFQQPVYIEDAVIGEISGIGVASHDTGIYTTVAQIQVGMLDISQLSGATATDVATLLVRRDSDYAGGVFGFVNSAIHAIQTVRADVTSNEFTFAAEMENYANAGGNGALIVVSRKRGVGETWGANIVAEDWTGGNSTALVGLELAMYAEGAASFSSRVLLDLIMGTIDTPGAVKGIANYAIRIAPKDLDSSKGKFEIGIKALGDYNCFMDLSEATSVTCAIHLKDASRIAFDTALTRTLRYDTGNLAYETNSGNVFTVSDAGEVRASGDLYLHGIKTLVHRITGYTNGMTGVANRATAYATGTITLQQLAERVKAIQDDLETHGIIGP